jgi:hypothetical protein
MEGQHMAKANNAVAVEKSRDDKFVEKAKMLVGRVIATFAASGLSVVGAGSLFGIEVWKSIALAGGLGVATVMEALSRAYLADGKLTTTEINEAFALVDRKKSAD